MNTIEQAGLIALGTQLQQLNDRLRKEAAIFYKSQHLVFEPKWFPIIYVLSVKPYISVVELSQEIGYAHPTTIGLLKELEKEGLIKSMKDAEDERKRNVSLTVKAKELIELIQPLWAVVLESLKQLIDTPNNLYKAIAEVNTKLKEKSFLDRMNEIFEKEKNNHMHTGKEIEIKEITNAQELAIAFAIRREVFVKGQHVSQELEETNNEDATHFLAYINGLPAGAARYRKTSRGIKLERFAVLAHYRGKGIADAMVKGILAAVPGDTPVYLNAQVAIAGLYKQNGFKQVGEEFEEANIKHFEMILAKEN